MNTRPWTSLVPLLLAALLIAGCGGEGSVVPEYEFTGTWGKTGEGPGAFRNPIGITYAGGELYVSDAGNNRIQVFDTTGTFLRQFDGSGSPAGSLLRPMHLEARADEEGPGVHVAVPEYGADRIRLFGSKGTVQAAIGTTGTGPGELDAPGGVALGDSGRIYVADFYNHRIKIVSPEGERLAMFGEQGRGEGQFERPIDVAFDETGTLYVADFGNDRIQVFRPVP